MATRGEDAASHRRTVGGDKLFPTCYTFTNRTVTEASFASPHPHSYTEVSKNERAATLRLARTMSNGTRDHWKQLRPSWPWPSSSQRP